MLRNPSYCLLEGLTYPVVFNPDAYSTIVASIKDNASLRIRTPVTLVQISAKQCLSFCLIYIVNH